MSILAEICARKRDHVRNRESQIPLADLKDTIKSVPPARGFLNKILGFIDRHQPALIAEIKKASPSGGLIRAAFDPAALAAAYEAGGGACLSVLTDTPYFQGQDEDLRQARNACTLPVLRKDFMVSPYQIYESRVLGADCILLIMAALEDSQAQDFYGLAVELGMDVLVEVHDCEELARALALDAEMIGVNNRNLKTLKTDLQTGLDLIAGIPEGKIRIAESGIHTPDDLKQFFDVGYNGFLVGESLMRQPDVREAVKTLLARDLTQTVN